MQNNPIASVDDYADAAALVGCAVINFKAVCLVESVGHGFDTNGFPVCLYEPHVAWRNASSADRQTLFPYKLAYPKQGTFPYGKYSDQPRKFQQCANFTRPALAIRATSFGLTQILGENFARCGFDTEEHFFAAMKSSEAEQLKASARLMLAMGLGPALKNWDTDTIALHWNGPGNVAAYSAKLSAARSALIASHDPRETMILHAPAIVVHPDPVLTSVSHVPAKAPASPQLDTWTKVRGFFGF